MVTITLAEKKMKEIFYIKRFYNDDVTRGLEISLNLTGVSMWSLVQLWWSEPQMIGCYNDFSKSRDTQFITSSVSIILSLIGVSYQSYYSEFCDLKIVTSSVALNIISA